MPTRWILVADPPHGDTNVLELAKRLELVALEVRGRLGYPIPDPWLVVDDEPAARALEKAVAAQGVRCVAVQAGELAHVPSAMEVSEIDLGDRALGWSQKHGTSNRLEWSTICSLIVYRTVRVQTLGSSETHKKLADRLNRAGGASGATGLVAGLFRAPLEAAARDLQATGGARTTTHYDEILELAGRSDQGPQRARFVKSELSFGGLGRVRQVSAHANWLTFVKLVGERATNARLDRRGEKAQLRSLTTVKKVALPAIFTDAPPRLAAIAREPVEFFGSFVAWRAGVLVERSGR